MQKKSIFQACTPLFLMQWGCTPQWVTTESPNFASIESNDSDTNSNPDPSDTEDPLPPLVSIDVRAEYFLGETIQFDASATYDPQNLDLTFEWQCSNGSTGTDKILEIPAQEEGNIDCTLEVTSEIDLTSTASASTKIMPPPEEAIWTVMVYIAGDNNLEDAGLEDINEMEMVGSTNNVNILVEFDRSRDYSNADGNWYGARRFYIRRDSDFNRITSPVMEDLGRVDSGDAQTIADFARWGIQHYPAQKYALIMWNHGWSWSLNTQSILTKGISSDDETGNDISIADGELTTLLQSVYDLTGERIELFGMDACIMQSWEIAHITYPFANFYVASQDYEDWDGWNYTDSLQDLVNNPTMDGSAFGTVITQRFFETDDATLSALDLSQLPDFESSLDSFAQEIMEANQSSQVYDAANASYSYDGSGWGEDHDVWGLAEYFKIHGSNTNLQNAAEDVQVSLQNLVISNKVQEWVSDAHGLNIYSPPQRNWGISQSYLDASWSEDTLWDELLWSSYSQ